MSRVRILNLPSDCTEKDLRDHFIKTAPQNAPPLEITDVMIKRTPPATQQYQHNNHRQGNRNVPAGKDKLGKIRMAFVGFQNSAAGHFVVKHYNNSYYRSAKIRVEIAKGLNDVGVTLNMKKKQERMEEALQRRTNNKRSRAENEGEGEEGVAQKRKADANAEEAGDTDEHTENPRSAHQQKRKELFIDERTKATEGPSWAAEVLIPNATPGSGTTTAMHASGGDALVSAAAPSHHDVLADDGENEEDRERAALERQQALGGISDMDFLQNLGGDAGSNPTEAAPHPSAGGEREDVEDMHHHFDGEERAQDEEATLDANDKKEEEADARSKKPEDIAWDSRRIRIGNIPYSATEDNIKQFASSLVGPVEDIHIPLTRDTKQSKGAAFVKFVSSDDAVRALTLCRGAILMGRLLRVSAAEEDPHSIRAAQREARQATTTTGDVAGSSDYKLKREMDKRQQQSQAPGTAHISWNSMYMNSHAAVETVAQRLGVKTDDVVNVQARGAAVRAAIAEAYLTTEIQQVLSDEGVDLQVLESGQGNLLKARSNTTILVKNLQLKSPDQAAELSKMFVKFGSLETSVFPSAGAFALFRYAHAQDARIAFTRLSYKLFRSSPLFLEWAPVGSIVEDADELPSNTEVLKKSKENGDDSSDDDENNKKDVKAEDAPSAAATTLVFTLFVTNLPFNETEDDFHAFMLDTCPRLAKAPETYIKRIAYQKEQGRAFITLSDASTFAYCQAKLNGKSFGGRVLSCVASKQTAQQQQKPVDTRKQKAEEDEDDALNKASVIARGGSSATATASKSQVPPGCDPSKIIVKNLPFEATEKDVRELFSAFSEIRSVRVPRKTHNFSTHRENNHRGFAFVEFLSEAEAARALEVLKATHLYGRHLVLQYAKLE